MRLPEIGATLDLSEKVELRARLEGLRNAHTTALVITQEQSEPVLDLAAHSALGALIELTVDPRALLSADGMRTVLARVSHTAGVWRNHPALIGYLIDCPVTAAELKDTGPARLQRALHRVIRAIRLRDTRALVALRHRPHALALAMAAEDFIYASVEGLAPAELTRFTAALHNLAMARPVVIEFPHPAADQDDLVATAFGVGAAGVVAPPVQRTTASGLLSLKTLSAEEAAPFLVLNGSCPPAPARLPMVSVVICAYNAERTMRACLESLARLRYANYEVVIVDDGSRDRTAEIAMEFPQFRLIRQPNKGLSVARNVGLHAAHGEIVAYTDSDCVVDPDWLTLMIRAMVDGGFDGCGGPNYAPHEEGRVEACVAASPGAPCHVLLADDRAEHLAGCNMAFSKAALVAVGGFDPQFTAAGDDVDICWRLLEAGYRLGYCPAAFVWHFRRNTIRAYYGQQRGYGRAEAMLYRKYPERFNALGQIKWRGTIPGLAATVPGAARPRIGWTCATAGWQTVTEQPSGIASFLPQTLEWHLLWSVAAALMWLGGLSPLPALAMLALGAIWALHYARRAPLEKCHDTLRARLLVALLAWSAPMARTWARWKTRLGTSAGAPAAEAEPRQRPALRPLARSLHLSYWNEAWTTREALLERLARHFSRAGAAVVADAGWNDFDLEVRPGPWTRLRFKTADEEHAGARLRNHVAVSVRLSSLSRAGLGALAGATALCAMLGLPLAAAALTALTMASALCAAGDVIESGRLAWIAVEQCAQELNLAPLGKPSAAARRAAARRRTTAPALAAPAELLADNRTAAASRRLQNTAARAPARPRWVAEVEWGSRAGRARRGPPRSFARPISHTPAHPIYPALPGSPGRDRRDRAAGSARIGARGRRGRRTGTPMSEAPHDLLSELYARAQAGDSRLGRALRSRTAGVVQRVLDGFQRNDNLLWASALTYTTGLSIVPILAVALSALKGLGGAEVIRPLIERFVGASSPEITDRLLSFVSRANARTLGAVGAATLLLTVVLTLGTIEQAFNQIFRVVRGRSLGRRFADYLSVTFAVPVLLAGALGVREILVRRLPEVHGAGWISSTLAIWAGFFFLYVFFPNRRVRLEAAALGSLVASILLQLAQWGFIYFQLGIGKYAAIYGALAAVPVLLTWIYMTWVVVLLGGEVTAAVERRNEPLAAEPWMQSERAVALMAVLRLGERMAGRPGAVTPASLAADFGVDEAAMAEVVRRLERGALVIESGGGADGASRGLFLARDSGAIALGEVVDCVRGDGAARTSAADTRVAAMVERLRAAERAALGALTVKDMVQRAAAGAPPREAAPADAREGPSGGRNSG